MAVSLSTTTCLSAAASSATRLASASICSPFLFSSSISCLNYFSVFLTRYASSLLACSFIYSAPFICQCWAVSSIRATHSCVNVSTKLLKLSSVTLPAGIRGPSCLRWPSISSYWVTIFNKFDFVSLRNSLRLTVNDLIDRLRRSHSVRCCSNSLLRVIRVSLAAFYSDKISFAIWSSRANTSSKLQA